MADPNKIVSDTLNILEGSDAYKENDTQKAEEVDSSIIAARQAVDQHMSGSLSREKRFLDQQTALQLKQRLDSLDARTRNEAQTEIDSRLFNVRNYMRSIDEGGLIRLSDGSEVSAFTVDARRGINSKEQYLEEFIRLDLTEQKRWLAEIQKDIESRTKQFNEMLNLVEGQLKKEEIAKFQTLRRSERKTYLQRFKKCTTEYTKLLDSSDIKSGAKRKALENFKQLGVEGREIALAQLKESLSVPQKKQEFKSASKKRQEKYEKEYGEFSLLSRDKQEEVLKKIRDEIKTEYMGKVNNCKVLTSADLQTFESTIKGRFDISFAELCLKDLDKSLEKAYEVENKMKELNVKPEVLNHFSWTKLTFFEKDTLIKSGKLKEYSENSEHLTLDGAYKKRLEKYQKEGKFGLINKNGLKSYMKWFEDLGLDKKRDIVEKAEKQTDLDFLEKTKKTRERNNKEFEELPKQIQKEFEKEYLKADFEQRMHILYFLKTETIKLDQEFTEKVDGMIKDHTLSPKERKGQIETFNGLNITQKTKYLKKSELDKPIRTDLLATFEDEIVPNLPQSKKNSIAKKFYKSTLNERINGIQSLLSQYVPDSKTDVKEILNKNLPDPKNIEDPRKLDLKDETLIEFAEKFEKEGDYKSALKFYETVLLNGNLDPKTKKEIEDKVEELKDDLEIYDDKPEKEAHFDQMIDSMTDDILESTDTLKQAHKEITILEELYRIQKKNEILYKEQATKEGQMKASLEDSNVIEFQAAISKETQDEYSLAKKQNNGIRLVKSNENEFDPSTYKESPQNFQKWEQYVAKMQQTPEQNREDATLCLKHPNTHQRLKAEQFKTEVLNPQRARLIMQVQTQLIENLSTDDTEINEKTMKAINDCLQKKDFRKKLQYTQSQDRQAA